MTSRTTSTPKAALVGRTVRTSLAALALISASTAATYAQTVPAPQAPASATQASSQTAASTNPFTVDQYVPVSAPATVAQGPAPAMATPKPMPFGHLPIIDATLDYTAQGVPFNAPIFNQGPGNQYHTYDPLDVGGTVRIPITPGIYAAFDRLVGGTVDQAVERVINTSPETHKATVTYPGYSRDNIPSTDSTSWWASSSPSRKASISVIACTPTMAAVSVPFRTIARTECTNRVVPSLRPKPTWRTLR